MLIKVIKSFQEGKQKQIQTLIFAESANICKKIQEYLREKQIGSCVYHASKFSFFKIILKQWKRRKEQNHFIHF